MMGEYLDHNLYSLGGRSNQEQPVEGLSLLPSPYSEWNSPVFLLRIRIEPSSAT